MDYLTLKKHCNELAQTLNDKPLLARIFTIPGRGFSLRLKRNTGFEDLVIQLEPSIQGCWLTRRAIEIDKSSNLLRQMQRLLINGRIVALELAGSEKMLQFDRVLKIQIAVIDNFFGHRSDFFIVCEFTGRIADLFLCDKNLKILERLGNTANNSIGNTYQLPDSTCRINPFTAELPELEKTFNSSPQSWFELIGGFSPQLAKELARRTRDQKTPLALASELKSILEQNSSEPLAYLVQKETGIQALYGFRPVITAREFPSVGAALDFAEQQLIASRRFATAQSQILQHFRRELKKREQIMEIQRQLLKEFSNAAELQKIGNLLVANLYQIPANAKSITLDDWETGQKLTIRLDPAKPASAQAQKYFQRYRKAQRGTIEVARRIKEIEADIAWLQEQIWLAENAASEADLPEIERKNFTKRKEKSEAGSGRRKKIHFPPILEIDDCRYYVGKNGRQNDLLTFQVAGKKDRWFHANDVPGAHVILKKLRGEIEEIDIQRGALLAAWFSFARDSSKVAVDTTEVAWVKKIPGGGPGRVSYTHQNTIFVNPQQARELIDASDAHNSGEET